MNEEAEINEYLILYGTQTGTAEDLAELVSKDLDGLGIPHTVANMFDITLETVKSFQRIFIIVSTWGDGDPPDDAEDLHKALLDYTGNDFDGREFAVFGLGDTDYDHFNKCAIEFDEALTNTGATQLIPLVKAGLEYDDDFDCWSEALLKSIPAMVE
jgi:sulfite reductase (NADPH) flavoprotein alpha-component